MSEEIKYEIKETVNRLVNAKLEFTIEDELEFAKVAVKNAEQKLEQVKQENERLLEIINAKTLETVDMDSAFEIEKLKEQLQAKEHEQIMMKADLCRGCQYRNDYKKVKKFVAGLMFDVDCANWFERFVFTFEDWKTELGNDRDKYKQALDEIEELCVVYSNDHDAYETVYKHILDIINKAKESYV